MSKPVFTWKPVLGAQRKIKPNVNKTQFGDGYELRVAQGINSIKRDWTLTFTTNIGEATSVLDFLEARGGHESFTWTDPLNRTGVYVCREWTQSQQMQGIYTINATFEEVFEY